MRRRKHTFRLIFSSSDGRRRVPIPKRRWRRMCAAFRRCGVRLRVKQRSPSASVQFWAGDLSVVAYREDT